MEITDVLKIEDDESVTFKKAYGEISLPESYFHKKMATLLGDIVEVFGVFYLKVWDDYNIDDIGTESETFSFQIFTKIILTPKNIREGIENGERCLILEFFENETIIKSVRIIQSILNVECALNLLFDNFIPESMSYSDVCNCLEESALLNNINYKTNMANIELIVMKMCRNPNVLNEEFRKVLAKDPDKSQYGFSVVRLLDAAKYEDGFSALISSNPMLGITNSIKDARKVRVTEESPVEKSIK